MAKLPRFSVPVAALAALLLSGCGFQLRQPEPLPAALARVSVEQLDPSGQLSPAVERELLQAGAQLDGSDAAKLHIVSERFDRQIVAVDERARVSEYLLNLQVSFKIDDSQGHSLLATEQFDLSRDYAFDELAAIGAGQEEALIREELTREAARRIVQRASRGLREH